MEAVLVVGALDLLVGVGGDEAAALVGVAEVEESGDAMGEGVVGLVVELVSVGDGVLVGDEEGGLAGGGVSVGSANGDDVAEVLGEGSAEAVVVGHGCADVGELLLLLALAGDVVTDEVVPVPCETIFEGEAGVDVLVGLLAVGGDAVEVVGLGKAGGGVGVTNGEARLRVGGDVVAEITDGGGGVVLVAWQRVRGVELAEGSVVVETVPGAGEGCLVAVGVEVAAVAGVVEHGTQGAAAGRFEVDDGGYGVGAVEGGVGAAIEFQAGEAGAGDGAEVEDTADVVRGDAVDEDLVGGGVAAANEEGCDSAVLTGLGDEDSGTLAKSVDDADVGDEVGLRDERHGRADLLDRGGDAGRGDGDLGGDGCDLKRDVLGDDVGAAAVEVRNRWRE